MNQIQHFGAGAFVATFAIFAASAIDTNAQYFAVENSNAIYSHGASVALAQMTKATDGKRAVDNFVPSVKTSATSRAIEVRGTVTSVSDGKIVVKSVNGEWTGIVTSDTKFPIAHGAAVQIKPTAPATPVASTTASGPVLVTPMTDGTQPSPAAPVTQALAPVQVGDRVSLSGRVLSGTKNIRLSMVRDFDVKINDDKQVNPAPVGTGTTTGVRAKLHVEPTPSPMPTPIAPVDSRKQAPGIAQPVPQVRN